LASKNFDFRALNRYLNPQATDDLNRFLEKLPQHAGHTALIAAGIAWAAAAALGLFAMMQTKQLTELRGQLEATEALKPVVPTLAMTPVPTEEIKTFADAIKVIYTGLTINSNGNIITIQSKDTSQFSQFREAIGHAVNGGTSWKINVDSFCVGRECSQNPLNAVLKVTKMKIDLPVTQ
jgi:hypothetical protein